MIGLRAIVYVSSATRPIPPHELDRLLVRARANNVEQDITGCLMFCDGNFMQYIEGPAEPLATTYALICRDRRHTDIYQIVNTAVATREFDGWAMAYTEAQLGDWSRLLESQWAADQSAPLQRPVQGVRMLHDFWVRHQPRRRGER